VPLSSLEPVADPQVSLTSYIPEKPQYCFSCGFWRFNSCKIGYITREDSKACKQAILRKDLKKAGLTP